MSLVVDACVAVKWFLPEDRNREAVALRHENADLIAPATALYEIYHAVWTAERGARRQGLDLAQLPRLLINAFAVLAPPEPLFIPAAELAAGLSHPIYDCLYLALAQRENAELVTADERLFAAARRARVKARML